MFHEQVLKNDESVWRQIGEEGSLGITRKAVDRNNVSRAKESRHWLLGRWGLFQSVLPTTVPVLYKAP